MNDQQERLTPEERVFFQKALRKSVQPKVYEPQLRAADSTLDLRLEMADIVKKLRRENSLLGTRVRKLRDRVVALERAMPNIPKG